eukprot:UN06886
MRVDCLSRKRCCDTTPDRYQEGSRLNILFRLIEGWWDPRA